MLRIRQFLALTGLTALETVRQPLVVLLSASCVAVIGLVPLLMVYQFGEEGRLARDSGLAIHLVLGLIVATTAACSALAREIRDGTASVVLTKPVGRELFFLSKFAGISVVVVAFSAGATAATLLAERISEKFVEGGPTGDYVTDFRTGFTLVGTPFLAYLLAGLMNYRTRRPFHSSAFGLLLVLVCLVLLLSAFFERDGSLGPFDFRVEWRIVSASLLVTVALVLFAALALGLSTRLDTLPTLVVCGSLFIVGLMSDYWFGRHGADSMAALLCHRLIPNWQHFWVSDALAGGGRVPAEYVLRALGYGVSSLAGILLLGMVSFRHTEVN